MTEPATIHYRFIVCLFYHGTRRANGRAAGLTDKAVVQQIAYLVNMAKAETLDTISEERESLELVEWYLEI